MVGGPRPLPPTRESLTDCHSCAVGADIAALPVREAIEVTEHWRVAHAFDSALPGWLVVLPRRHVEAVHELTPDEMAPLGELVRRLSIALVEVTGCQKTYVMQYAEHPKHRHVHFHVVPRMADFTDDEIGPRVFAYLGRDDGTALSDDTRDDVSRRIQAAVGRVGVKATKTAT